MIRQLCRTLAVAVPLALVCTTASAQPIPSLTINPFKWCQPWAPKLAAQRSAVMDCNGTPIPGYPVALDDWICTKSGPITRVTWWGTECEPIPGLAPVSRFYIAVWLHDPNTCKPLQRIYQCCVDAKRRRVGIDCVNAPNGNRVYQYSAKLTCPFTQVAGTHYWLQISEVQLTPNIPPRWCWSEHRPIKNCPAAQGICTAAGGCQIVCPLFDVCDMQPSDLAFCLGSRSIVGTITPAGTLTPQVYQLYFICPTTGEIVEKECITPDPTGFFHNYTAAPDGAYLLWIGGMASPGDLYPAPVMLMDGQELDVGEWRLFHGNSDADVDVDFGDILNSLANFGAMGPMPPPE